MHYLLRHLVESAHEPPKPFDGFAAFGFGFYINRNIFNHIRLIKLALFLADGFTSVFVDKLVAGDTFNPIEKIPVRPVVVRLKLIEPVANYSAYVIGEHVCVSRIASNALADKFQAVLENRIKQELISQLLLAQ